MASIAVTKFVRGKAYCWSILPALYRLGTSAVLAAGLLLSVLAAQAQAQTTATFCTLPLQATYSGYSGSGTGSANINQTEGANFCSNANIPGTRDSDISYGLYPSSSYNAGAFINASTGAVTPTYSNGTVTSFNGVQYRVSASSADAGFSSTYTFTLVGTNTSLQATDYIAMYSPNTNVCPGGSCPSTPTSPYNPIYIQIDGLPTGPSVTAIAPTSGPLVGGNSVVITGTNLTGTAGAGGVRFGATNATSYSVNSNTQITALAPAGSAGTVDVTITNGGITSNTVAADQYTYAAAPTVTSISPTAGPTGGATSIIITGTNLSGATAVIFGATAATGFTVNSATQITATSPAGSAGSVDITVTTAGGTSATSVADQFTYVAAPTVSSISPTTGPGSGGTVVTITGTNLSGATAVNFGATAATGFTVVSPTSITATAPAGTGAVDIRVTTAGGTSATSGADQFTYIPAPTVTSISPTAGPTVGSTVVTLTGTNFTGVTAVAFGSTPAASFTFNSATSITATSPAGTGNVDIRVTTAGGTSATSGADQFTYVGAPTVTSIAPTVGPATGGTSVIITGTNLSGATAVIFGATAATGFTVNSATQITATSPAGSAGNVDITVTTAGGTSATSVADQFTYVAAPTVSSISPTTGPGAGGTVVTLTGTNLSAATTVVFGATAATGFTVVSPTSITATAPSGTGTVDIRVTTAGGTSAISGADQFTYIPASTVTSISPTAGPTAGATVVTLTGTNFSGATAVTFGATPATGFTVNSATSITATSPAGTGTVDIRVTTAGGTSATSAADQFTYVGAPTVTLIALTSGPLAGGTSVSITGTGFSGATAVAFGVTAATGFTVNSATSITATSPAGSAGTVDIRVTTVGGTSATSAADQFTYVGAPTVSSISPTTGPGGGGTVVTLTGTNLSGATAVTFGATAAAGFTVVSPTSITATSPAGTGTIDIRVTTAGGTSATSAADQFIYVPAPTVTAISPTTGPAGGGTVVILTGTNFTGVTAVTFGATAATSFTVNSATSITATSSAGIGTVDIRVTATGGTSATSAADQFTYVGAPTVTLISPTSGPLAGATSVTITGTGFSGATAVAFGATAATGFTVNSATSITATSPAGSAGAVDIRITTVGGTSATSSADQFTYVGAPTVTSIAPPSGPLAGATSVTITGTGFNGATAVTFGATAATGLTINSATSITVTSPAGTGTVDVRVTNPGGTSAASAADQFTYVAGPTITSISPTAGPASGGTVVTITGTNFSGATAVTFGATAAASYTVNSATSITATSPIGAGAVDVRVTTTGGTSATAAADLFSYIAAPVVTAILPASGPASGGTSVTVTGSGFIGTSGPGGVRFGAANATSYVVNSASSITAVAPAGTGTIDVIITNGGQISPPSPADQFAYLATTTQTALTSSQNPSNAGQSVTFTATVTSPGGTPTGTVTFNDGGVAIGTGALTAGIAIFSTAALTVGAHTITARYGGSTSFAQSTSPALVQTVNVPIDSIRLRAMQLNVTKMIAQNSGQAMSGAIFDAISEGFSEVGYLVLPNANGVRINFSADPRDDDDAAPRTNMSSYSQRSFGTTNDPITGGATTTSRGRAPPSRIDDAFAAIDRQLPRKAPARWREEKQWLLWAEVRTTGVDRWNSAPTAAGTNQFSQSSLYGRQLNTLFGLTYKAAPNFLIGLVGGWETFDYTQQDINGRLKGDGWTTGAYLGWLMTPALRYDATVTYSGIGYEGSAGSAKGNFNGERWMFATGFTGTHQIAGFLIEPSLRVYALWEHQQAYVDSLGTAQGTNDFASGRASAGLRAAYPVSWFNDIVLTPYFGMYGDYYFSEANAAALVGVTDAALASTPLLQGWSARATGGLGSKFANGAGLLIGGELGGIGNNSRIWTFSAKARVPF